MIVEVGTDIVVRDMVAADVAEARELSRALNWPHRTVDWQFLFDLGSGVVAVDREKLVGTAMCWRFGPDAATVGLVIVSPDCQGQGLGRRLMEAVLDRLGDRSVMLNATEEGLPLYRMLGFEFSGRIFQHQGTAFDVPIVQLQPDERVRPMGRSDAAAVAELDRRATGVDRKDLIARLLKASKGVILTRNNEPVGFALFRRFGRGYTVGPTVAPDQAGARTLISHWLGSKAGMFCRLDVTEESGLSPWLDELGLPLVGQVTQMIRGRAPQTDPETKLFSLVSQALG
jgi:GNAT superfamily N-acetyltransferase